MRLLPTALICLLLTGCGYLPSVPFVGNRAAAPSEPLPFQTRLVGGDENPEFAVSVASGGAGLEAVRESVRFEGTRYCLARFGFSDIVWDAPAGAPDQWTARAFSDGATVYTGTCLAR